MRKMQSYRTAIRYLAILIAFGVSTVNGQLVNVPIVNCPPALVSPNLIGRITQTTFTLQEYCCLRQSAGFLPTDTAVTIVGPSDAIRNVVSNPNILNNSTFFSNISNNGIIAALSGSISDFCSLNGNVLGGIRIGPLPLGGPYSVRILVYRNGTLIGITVPSDDISLRNPIDYNLIDTNIKHHSAGMIAITTILPILFALLLCLFSAMLFMKCCCCCRVFTPTKCEQDT